MLIASTIVILTVALSLVASWATLRLAHHWQVGGDETDGCQKMHDHWVPRLGGVPIFFAIGFGSLSWAALVSIDDLLFALLLGFCSLPIFVAGLMEDLTRNVSVRSRLAAAFLSAAMACSLLAACLHRVDIPGLDLLLSAIPFLAIVISLVGVAGFSHAFNIIDGCNGLASGVGIIYFLAISLIAIQVDDGFVAVFGFICVAAVVGFFFWNYPFGRLFLGDAGAYTLGFLVAVLGLLLTARNPEVSPWSIMLIGIYPVWETLFSIVRRAKYRMSQLGEPDALHLHQLLMRRYVKRFGANPKGRDKAFRNSVTSIYLWIMAASTSLVAVACWDYPDILMIAVASAVFAYTSIYRGLVRFSSPELFRFRHHQRPSADIADS